MANSKLTKSKLAKTTVVQLKKLGNNTYNRRNKSWAKYKLALNIWKKTKPGNNQILHNSNFRRIKNNRILNKKLLCVF